MRTDFFGLTGHQLFGATYPTGNSLRSTRTHASYSRTALRRGERLLERLLQLRSVFYEPKKGSGEGIGGFGRFGASDGDPNFMHFFYSLGIGGKGVIPSRERDRYGFGFYYIDVKNPKFQGLFRTTKLLRDEYGFEAFYNIAITPWLMLTPDIQVVRGAQKEKITIGRGPVLGLPFIASRKSIGTATILACDCRWCFEKVEGKSILQGAEDSIENVRDGLGWTAAISEETDRFIFTTPVKKSRLSSSAPALRSERAS